jgi:hypothetical protein
MLPSPTCKSEKKINYRLVEPHNLGALEAKTGHQTLLIEGECVDAAMQGVGGKTASHSFVHDDHARADLFALIGRKFVVPTAARL